MNAEISKEVLDKIKEAQRTNPEMRLPVIITLEPSSDSDFSNLESEGLVVEKPLAAINAVAGTVPANRIGRLARQPRIRMIEYDGEVRAIKTE